MEKKNTKKVTNIDDTRKPLKHLSVSETRDFILENMSLPDDLTNVLRELGSKIIPQYLNGDSVTFEKLNEKVLHAMIGLEENTHAGLTISFNEEYRALTKEFSTKVINEYSCVTALEKAFAEIIANAYVRILDNSRRLNNELSCKDITPNRNNYIANLSKQLDRTHRQLTSAVFSLKQLKQPQIEVNVKAINAFVSQNQQINVNKKDEIVEA